MSHLSNDSHYHVGAEEISNISKMFSKLISASIERTQNYVHAATLSYPYLPGLATNNIGTNIMRQAFAKIDTISHVSYEQVLSSLEGASGDIHASHAVLAGHGLGLCQPGRRSEEQEDCECEQHLPKNTYLLAAYYSHGIEIILTEETTSVYDLQSYTYNNYSLGYHSKPSNEQQRAYYWDNVREFIRNALLEHPGLIPRTAILYGDRCTDVEFRTALVEVLYQFLGHENVNWLQDGVDPVFAGALGAAELLKRKRFRQLCLMQGRRKIGT